MIGDLRRLLWFLWWIAAWVALLTRNWWGLAIAMFLFNPFDGDSKDDDDDDDDDDDRFYERVDLSKR